MAIQGNEIVGLARDLLNDSGARWLDPTCLRGLNFAQREIVTYLPSANSITAKPMLQAGTRQTMTGLSLTNGLQFLDVPRNFSADGNTPGRSIIKAERAWLDETRPDWHSDTPSQVIQHYCLDNRDPKAMYVWPPSTGDRKAEVIYSAAPADLAALASNISLDDIYANPMAYYLLFYMLTVNKPGQAIPQLAQVWYSQFLQVLGVKDQRVRSAHVKDPS